MYDVAYSIIWFIWSQIWVLMYHVYTYGIILLFGPKYVQ